MSIAKLKKQLKEMPKEEIIDLVSNLYNKVPYVKDFLDVFISYDVKTLLEKYKKEISKLVNPNGRLETKEVEARKLIRTIRKMKIDELNIGVELHYVDCCLNFIEDYGYWDHRYYIATEKMFDDAQKKILNNGWEDAYKEQLNSLIIKRKQIWDVGILKQLSFRK
ncbi:MAG: DUF6155 family protein [Polaribacter sp.]